jgi:hypothetical protein
VRDGLTFFLAPTGRVEHERRVGNRGLRDFWARKRLLEFGDYWRFRTSFDCSSTREALTCWNRSGHGFRIDRPSGWRTF